MDILRATKLKYGAIHSADPKQMCPWILGDTKDRSSYDKNQQRDKNYKKENDIIVYFA